jgi:tryptophan halogenase
LSAGFLEPLESTSIQLVINAVWNLLDHFPDRDFDARNRDSFNAELILEFERVRDFIVLHYCLTQREDSDFWRQCRSLRIPDSLLQRLEMYRATGRIRTGPRELFTDLSWFYILDGMGVAPRAIDPLVDGPLFAQVQGLLANHRAGIRKQVGLAPAHASHFTAGSGPSGGHVQLR